MKLVKGSLQAKRYMASIRAKKNNTMRKKIGSVKASKEVKETLKDKNLYLPHGYKTVKRKRKIGEVHTDTKSHNVKIDIVSGLHKVINNSFYLDKVVSILNYLEKDIENLNFSLKEKGLSNVQKNHIRVFLRNRKNQFSIAKKSLNTFASFR